SKTDGVMHACGHDGHVATTLGAARILRQSREAFSGQIKFVLQPAEERLAGATEMIRQGVLSEPKVDAALGFHLYNSMPTGQVAFRTGPTMAGADSFVMEIRGRGGHAAVPDEAIDAILISSHVITSLQALVSKEASPHTPLVVHVGTIHGGNAFNVVADRVELRGTVRALDANLQHGMREKVERIVSHTASAFRGDFSLEYDSLCCPLVNDPAMVRLVREQALQIAGAGNVIESGPIMASDDMAFFLQEVPGCFFYVGAADREKGAKHPFHHPLFDFDEDAMPIAAEVLVRSTLAFLSSPA
ncbi:MAG: amidohydrolase, partial [Deltaproteobacteria bacterium]|nr:amidohydrolase [Deltaproteobacteria bacterium]